MIGDAATDWQLASSVRLLPDAEVLAVGSRRPEAAAWFAERHGIPRAYGSWAGAATNGVGEPGRRRRRASGQRPPLAHQAG